MPLLTARPSLSLFHHFLVCLSLSLSQILMSGLDKKVELTQSIKKLGGSVVTSPMSCSHLIIDCQREGVENYEALKTTAKLLTVLCMEAVVPIVHSDWVRESETCGKWLPVEDYECVGAALPAFDIRTGRPKGCIFQGLFFCRLQGFYMTSDDCKVNICYIRWCVGYPPFMTVRLLADGHIRRWW
jgi:hypothetical protein